MRTKQEFRATRERVGMSQAYLARLMGVSTRSVRYWEDANSQRVPPDEAWEILGKALRRQREVISFAYSKVDEVADRIGHMPESVQLPYWLSESEYNTLSTDAAYGLDGDWRMANANSIIFAAILEADGVEVEWVEGNPARPDGTWIEE